MSKWLHKLQLFLFQDYLLENNGFMKRTINESQLKAIVAESVKRVLGEMDWKTYQWAADERDRRNANVSAAGSRSPYAEKYAKRSGWRHGTWRDGLEKYFREQQNNAHTADNAFNQQYGIDGSDTNGRVSKYGNELNGLAYSYGSGEYPDERGMTSVNKNMGRYQTTYSDKDNSGKFHTDYDKNGEFASNKLSQYSKEVGDKFKKADQELNNYRNGNYTYVKGKGWELKK